VQTRGADESSTQFLRCTKCNYTFREYSWTPVFNLEDDSNNVASQLRKLVFSKVRPKTMAKASNHLAPQEPLESKKRPHSLCYWAVLPSCLRAWWHVTRTTHDEIWNKEEGRRKNTAFEQVFIVCTSCTRSIDTRLSFWETSTIELTRYCLKYQLQLADIDRIQENARKTSKT
jgi:hypothetical protein